MKARKDYIHRVKKIVRLTDPRLLSDPGAENVFYFSPRADIGKFLRVCLISRLLVLERWRKGVERDEKWADDMWDMYTRERVENLAVLYALIEQL